MSHSQIRHQEHPDKQRVESHRTLEMAAVRVKTCCGVTKVKTGLLGAHITTRGMCMQWKAQQMSM